MRRCPFCAEDIADDATTCPYCASDLTQATAGVASASASPPPATVSAPPPAGGTAGAPAVGSVRFSHTGQRYLLGFDDSHFGIWDRSAPAAPVERFPRSDEGWSEAWRRYSSLEPANQPVQAVAGGSYGGGSYLGGSAGGGSPGAGYGAPPAGGAAPYGAPQAGWGQHAGYPPHGSGTRRTNGMAVASLVLGIAGVPLFFLIGIPSILALVFGAAARREIRDSAGTQEGDGMAVAGIVLGIVGLVLLVLGIIGAAINNNQ